MKRGKALLAIIALLITIATLTACSFDDWLVTKPASICDQLAAEGEESYLCKMRDTTGGIMTPERADFLLRLAVAADLQERKKDAPKVMAICDEGIKFLESGAAITYEKIAEWTRIKIGPLVSVVLGEAVDQMVTLQVPILEADRGMLIYHLKRQRALAELAMR